MSKVAVGASARELSAGRMSSKTKKSWFRKDAAQGREPTNGQVHRPSAGFAITFTGQRQKSHYQIDLDGSAVGLTYSALNALIRLVIARGSSATGFVRLSPVTITRLRQALGRAAGLDTGMAIIETGCGEEYHLTIPREHLASRVAIDPSFFELEELKVLSAEQVQQLRRMCRVLESS